MGGFEQWVKKAIKISEGLNVPIIVKCSANTRITAENLIEELNLGTPFHLEEIINWEDFIMISKVYNCKKI